MGPNQRNWWIGGNYLGTYVCRVRGIRVTAGVKAKAQQRP